MTVSIEDKSFDLEKKNSVALDPVSAKDFVICPPVRNGTVRVNVMEYLSLDSGITKLSVEELSVKDGQLLLGEDMAFMAVLNRYGKGTKSLGIVKNFGLKQGAVASTVSHDSHNLTLVYLDPEDAACAANALIEAGGGMAAASEGRVRNILKLEVGGLMTKLDAEALTKAASDMKKTERELGITVPVNPLLRIVSLALPVIPSVKLSDLGLVRVEDQTLLPLFV